MRIVPGESAPRRSVASLQALSWAFYCLAYDQELQQRVADEVKDLPDEVSPQQLVTGRTDVDRCGQHPRIPRC